LFVFRSWYPLDYVGPVSVEGKILIRWHSKNDNLAAEPYSVDLIRPVREFTQLPVECFKPDKKVLVKDHIEHDDFCGVSYWLAIMKGQPFEVNKKGKKRGAETEMMIRVQYQNDMWPDTDVPANSIYVLPRVKGDLGLPGYVETRQQPQLQQQPLQQQQETIAPSTHEIDISPPMGGGSVRSRSPDSTRNTEL
jgi:hypothetical protein